MMASVSAWLGIGFLISEIGLAWRRRAARTMDSQEVDGGSLRLLWRTILISIAVGVILALYGIGPRLPGGFAWQWLSLGLFVAGTVVRWWAIWHLGRFFTVNVAVAGDHRVVDTGPYRWVRHPSYTGLLLQFGALALAMNNVFSLLTILVPIWLALRHRILVEEAALSAALGESYSDYARTRKRLVPLVY